MVLAHVMSEEENKAIITRAVKELFPVKGIATPYMYHHVTEALFEAGLQEEAIRLLKSYWGEMLRLGLIPSGRHLSRKIRIILLMEIRS